MPLNVSTNYDTRSVYSGSTGSNQSLNVDEFLKLISAQLQNQDMMNPMSDTEFISQLAQFTSLQVAQNISENQSISMALGFMGKEVTAVSISSTGALEKVTGVVDKVSLYEGTPMVTIGDKKFSLYQIMEIGKTENGGTPDSDPDPDGSTT